MGKTGKILISIIGLLLVIGIPLAVWQWNNVTALRYLVTMDSQTVEKNIDQNDKQLEDMMEEYQISEQLFSKEELKVIAGDDQELDRASQALLKKLGAVARPKDEKKTSAKKHQPGDHSEKIRGQIAKMYVLKATYVSALDGIVGSVKAQFAALPANQRTDAKKQQLIKSRMGELSSLENTCDQKVAVVVSELRRLLKADGEDDSVADLVESTYSKEKSLKKAYYIGQF